MGGRLSVHRRPRLPQTSDEEDWHHDDPYHHDYEHEDHHAHDHHHDEHHDDHQHYDHGEYQGDEYQAAHAVNAPVPVPAPVARAVVAAMKATDGNRTSMKTAPNTVASQIIPRAQEDLRWVLIRCVAALGVAMVAALPVPVDC